MSADAAPPTGVRARQVSPARLAKYRAEREQIMRAAYRLIQQNGSRETSVHDVLRETGFSTRAFYRHFRSKDELVIEMYRVDSDRVTDALVAAVTSAPTPLDRAHRVDRPEPGRRVRRPPAAARGGAGVARGGERARVHRGAGRGARGPTRTARRAPPRGKQRGVFPLAQPDADAFAIQAVVLAHMRSRLVGSGRAHARRGTRPHRRALPARPRRLTARSARARVSRPNGPPPCRRPIGTRRPGVGRSTDRAGAPRRARGSGCRATGT